MKHENIKVLINDTLSLLSALGIPLKGMTDRSLETMAMAFLAVVDINSIDKWETAKDLNDKRSMKSRDIIEYWNLHFDEHISSGSYDNIRRKDLLLPLEAGIIIPSKPNSPKNSPSRGYALNPEFTHLVRRFKQSDWLMEVEMFFRDRPTLARKLEQRREIPKIEIQIPNGHTLEFSPGGHNQLQKAIVEEFLPLFGHGAILLYLGDTASKHIIFDEETLIRFGFTDLKHGVLPDIIAYSPAQNWLFVIEAVYSCNPVTIVRKLKIDEITASCEAGIIYVSAFPNKETYAKYAGNIAWETEVWIADNPEHMIHLNGDKFLGPYKKR